MSINRTPKAATPKAETPEAGADAGLTRRDFLKFLGVATFAAATANVLSQVAVAQEGGELDPSVDETLTATGEALLESPESFDNAEGIRFLICLNFLDAIVSIGRKRQPLLGAIILQVLNIKGFNDKYVGMQREHVEFPTVSFASGVALNAWLAQQGEEYAHGVKHTFQEAAQGAAMMTLAASLSKGVRAEEKKRIEELAGTDEATVDTAVANVEMDDGMGSRTDRINRIPNEINTLQDSIAEVIQMAPLAAALSQFTLFAAGNAAITGGKMQTVLKANKKIGELFLNLSAKEFSSCIERVENSVIQKLLKASFPEGSQSFTSEHAQAFAYAYTQEIGLGMMSATIDLSQTAFGDVGPSIAAPLQSVGAAETLKTSASHFIFSLLIAVEETIALEQRMGLPFRSLVNAKYARAAGSFAKNCFTDLIRYFVGKPSEGDVHYHLVQQLTADVSALFLAIVQGATRLTKWGGSEAKVDAVLFDKATAQFEELQGLRRALADDPRSGNDDDSYDSKMRNASLLFAGLEINDTNAGKGNNLKDTFKKLEKIIAAGSPLDEKKRAFLEQLKRFSDLVANVEKGGDFKAKVANLQHLLGRESGLSDLMDFNYWVAHLGSEVGETAFIVFLQGVHLSGLIPTMSKGYALLPTNKYSHTNKALALTGSFAATTTLSTVADNWAAALTSMKLIPKNIYLPLFASKYGFNRDEIELREEDSPFEQFRAMHAFIKNKVGSSGGDTAKVDSEIYEAFSVAKSLSILSGVLGGGETTIGNSPHFAAIVGELKKILTLGASVTDIAKHFMHHSTRFLATLGYAMYATPLIETTIFGNPFKEEEEALAA